MSMLFVYFMKGREGSKKAVNHWVRGSSPRWGAST